MYNWLFSILDCVPISVIASWFLDYILKNFKQYDGTCDADIYVEFYSLLKKHNLCD